MLEADLNPNESGSLSRRAVLCGAIALTLGLATDFANASEVAVGVKSAGSKLKIDLAKNKVLAKVNGAVTIPLSDGSTVAVVRTSKAVNGFVALNLSCTHQGVQVEQSGSSWSCPAHGSQFSMAGKVLRGPARSALVKYPVSATSKVVTVG